MKFNLQLKNQLIKYEKVIPFKGSTKDALARKTNEKSKPQKIRIGPGEKVVGGDIIWKPVDRSASMILAKPPWWAYPPKPENKQQVQQPKKRKPMVKHASELIKTNNVTVDEKKWIVFGNYAIEVKSIDKKTGEPLFDTIDMWPLLLEQINSMRHELSPAALALIDGEKALLDATSKAKQCMEDLRATSKVFLDEIRQTKYATLAETSALISPLKDIRQFFFDKDYKDQIERLKEFVGLCERLQKLKETGFLDSVADTMLRLSDADKS